MFSNIVNVYSYFSLYLKSHEFTLSLLFIKLHIYVLQYILKVILTYHKFDIIPLHCLFRYLFTFFFTKLFKKNLFQLHYAKI